MIHQSRKRIFEKAQSIIELSILGAALLGILALMIRYSTGLSQGQATQLKAMRVAMRMSAEEGLSIGSPVEPEYGSRATDNTKKQGHRKSAAVLWIEDVPTIEGGEKYGATSVTPMISFGSATLTNTLQYPLRYGDPSQLPYMDIFVNGKHFSFTTFGYRYYHYDPKDGGCLIPPDQYRPRCLWTVPLPSGGAWWFSDEPRPVAWTQIPRTDPNFCYAQNDPPDHNCGLASWDGHYDERFRLDPFNPQPVTDIALRKKLQWQWFPILLNNAVIDYLGKNGGPRLDVDVDYDGHEETIINFHQRTPEDSNELAYVPGGCRAGYYNYKESTGEATTEDEKPWVDPQSDACKDSEEFFGGGWVGGGAWVVDSEAGDLAMTYNTIDKLRGKPKPGFNQAKGRIITKDKGELDIAQQPVGTNTEYRSKQTKDTVHIVEREIQLSNNIGRFDRDGQISFAGHWYMNCISGGPGFPVCYRFDGDLNGYSNSVSNENDAVEVTCSTAQGATESCCYSSLNKYRTCFDRTSLVLYVRSILEGKVGHKYKTNTPVPSFP